MTSPLLRFAVIADSHVNPSDTDRISSSESRILTNHRLDHTIAVLNTLRPAFVMHVGDMVHPIPEAVSYPRAVERFRRAVAGLDMPLHAVAGNHDIGDKQADYVPAGAIRSEYVSLYREHFGPDHYGFNSGGCHFVVINTSLINSGLAEEDAQREWLESDLAAHAGRRIFLFVHYPPFIANANERGHYDNIDEPGRGWLLAMLKRHSIAAVFTGHVHNFFFNQHGETPIFSLPSTGFVRADYTEMFSVAQPPEHEGGRNDSAKLGLLIVDVHADRIVPQFIRTFDPPPNAGESSPAQLDWPWLPPAAGGMRGLGIDLRHHWAELHSIPYSSMLDEFHRKEARNDYPVLALWEMGIGHLRVPVDDLLVPAMRERMEALGRLGTRFTVFAFDWPDEAVVAAVATRPDLLLALEVVLKWPLPPHADERLAQLSSRCGVPLHLSRFWNASGQSRDGKVVKLLVDHGFLPGDPTLHELAGSVATDAVDALVFRVSSSMPARVGVEAAVKSAGALGLRAQVHVRLASDSPNEARNDARVNGNRVLEAALCAFATPATDVFLDTLADVDRGYFPRAGLVDRLCNPRPAGRALRNLHGILSGLAPPSTLEWTQADDPLVGVAVHGQRALVLVLPGSNPAASLPDWPAGFRAAVRWNLAASSRVRAGDPGWDAAMEAPTVFELIART